MSGKNKLIKFEALKTLPNVFEYTDEYSNVDKAMLSNMDALLEMKGNWSDYFKNNHPIILELACGGGEYTVALAQQQPTANYIGVDIKGNRIWKGASAAQKANLSNAAFLRTRIEFIERFFAPNEVSEIWITFPDPFLKKSKSNRRLTAPLFLERYKNILKPGGLMHLKTDDPTLYEFTMETLQNTKGVVINYHHHDIYGEDELFNEALSIKTKYEGMHLEAGKTIKYIQFTIW